MTVRAILVHIYEVLLILALILGAVKFRKLSKSLNFVFLFVVIGFLTEIITDIWKHFVLRNTMPIGNFYIPVSILSLGVFYFFLLKDYINKKILLGVIIVYELMSIFNFIFYQNILKFPNITAAIGALILITFSILTFSKVMSEAKIENISKEPVIWFNTAFLIYYSVNFFFYILFNIYVEKFNELALLAANVYAVVNILLYALISIGFLKVKAQQSD